MKQNKDVKIVIGDFTFVLSMQYIDLLQTDFSTTRLLAKKGDKIPIVLANIGTGEEAGSGSISSPQAIKKFMKSLKEAGLEGKVSVEALTASLLVSLMGGKGDNFFAPLSNNLSRVFNRWYNLFEDKNLARHLKAAYAADDGDDF